MSKKKNTFNQASDKVQDTLKIGVYVVYDTVLKQFDLPLVVPVNKLYDFMSGLVNDIQSKYYKHESDYVLNKIGDFDVETGIIEQHFIQRVNVLDFYIDNKIRNLQTVIQTLNYLPTGYFKMPEEQKKAIQDNINSATQKYVANYVVPDLDINSEKIKSLEDKINECEAVIADYEERLNILS